MRALFGGGPDARLVSKEHGQAWARASDPPLGAGLRAGFRPVACWLGPFRPTGRPEWRTDRLSVHVCETKRDYARGWEGAGRPAQCVRGQSPSQSHAHASDLQGNAGCAQRILPKPTIASCHQRCPPHMRCLHWARRPAVRRGGAARAAQFSSGVGRVVVTAHICAQQ